jgi:voltage-gated potassium channel
LRKSFMVGLSISAMAVIYSLVFMWLMNYEGQTQNVDAITAIYWVTSTITTLGYGDIVFRSHAGRLFTIIVSLSGLFVLWAVILPLEIMPRIDRLARIIPSSAPPEMSGHTIICGYNPVVDQLAERFSMLKIPFLIMERSENVARKIYQRYPTMLGDPSDPNVLANARLEQAKLFISNEAEELNAEVIMAVREISNIEIIALVDDLTRCRFLKYAGASRIISPKTLLGDFIAQISVPSDKPVLPGAIALFGDQMLVELPIYPWSELIGKSLSDVAIKDTGANIVGIWQKGVFKPNPRLEDVIQPNSVLMAVGDKDQLLKIRELFIGNRREGAIIIIGYGDVGRLAARTICKRGIKPVIIDRRDLGDLPMVHITGDGTSEEALVKAGIEDAVGVLVMINRDAEVIYSTLHIRNLNPSTFIVARANHVRSAKKIYRAGADYVASVPIIAGHMLAKIALGEEEELAMLYEDLELELFEVHRGSGLAGKTVGKIDLPGKFGCGIAAIERGGHPISRIDGDTVLARGDLIAIIGSPAGLEVFIRTYNRRKALLRR